MPFTSPAVLMFLLHWALALVQRCRKARDMAGRRLKVLFLYVLSKINVFNCGPPSSTHSFFGPLIYSDCSRNVSTIFVGCVSFRARSSNLVPVAQSFPNFTSCILQKQETHNRCLSPRRTPDRQLVECCACSKLIVGNALEAHSSSTHR